ncbi:peptidyl-prolyl cis-trans isomerase B (cyclophilin B) [Hymenobacter daecheongensis DSM 21074]|uniref:Peptidyl-prolyl cis-trans isomerase n=1 Tax=Hymenobacter daecheongensis DSM 21074 TaxID=1121955 RepID=A0A1M6G5B3_9BACT|nr:peptidylprolyl isomerase [Hymenobacter daecheongensis]SHJ05122.1 peptidyl-prolyl cis-trans isomerase B (cyclophilin B) [Hymenobacter daecheongensis DSM 21074]
MKASLLFSLLLAGLLASCGQPEKPAATAPAPPPPVPGPSLSALTDTNATALLTQYGREFPASEVIVHTRLGDMRVKLYDDVPVHKANFLLLARKGVFDETVFNRVVKGFAIQGGRSDHRTIRINRYHLPPEIVPQHFHKRGALGMARYDDDQNPGKLSSNSDFYIVQGEKLTPAQSAAMAGRPLTPAQQQVYATQGGAPSLDGKYTVFGEVVEGLDVIDKIAAEPVGTDKWPKKDVEIKVEVLK